MFSLKKLSLLIFCSLTIGCMQVQRDGGRALSNANGVVSSGASKLWHAPQNDSNSNNQEGSEKEKVKSDSAK